jgi:excisionase family DNA binding protein
MVCYYTYGVSTVLAKAGEPDMDKTIAVESEYVTPREAATMLHLSIPTIYVLMTQGDLPSCKFGRARRIPKRALREYEAKAAVPA